MPWSLDSQKPLLPMHAPHFQSTFYSLNIALVHVLRAFKS